MAQDTHWVDGSLCENIRQSTSQPHCDQCILNIEMRSSHQRGHPHD